MAESEFFDPQGLADYLGVPLATVYKWNHEQTGPPAYRVGRHVRYRRSETDQWVQSKAMVAKEVA